MATYSVEFCAWNLEVKYCTKKCINKVIPWEKLVKFDFNCWRYLRRCLKCNIRFITSNKFIRRCEKCRHGEEDYCIFV